MPDYRKEVSVLLRLWVLSLLLHGLGCERAPSAPSTPPRLPPAPPPASVESYQEEWVGLPVQVSFRDGDATISQSFQLLLEELVGLIHARDDVLRIRVTGYASPFRSDRLFEGIELERAQVVADFLVDELGLPREMIEVERVPPASGPLNPTTPIATLSMLLRRSR